MCMRPIETLSQSLKDDWRGGTGFFLKSDYNEGRNLHLEEISRFSLYKEEWGCTLGGSRRVSFYGKIKIYIYVLVSKYISKYMSKYMYKYISKSISKYMSKYISEYISDYISKYVSKCMSKYIYISIYLSVCISVCLSIYLSVCLSICLSICLNVYRILNLVEKNNFKF